jgi:hypothetical protein
MKILFLDIDGVLNSGDWFDRFEPPAGMAQWRAWERASEAQIDPDAVARLNYIIEKTKALVVVSSVWRCNWDLPTLTNILRRRGFEDRLFAATPELVSDPTPCPLFADLHPRHERGTEIADWLGMLLPDRPSFVILDDDNDMGGLTDRLVQTDHRHGLTKVEMERAIEMLGASS